jgi:hypothetical protein
MTTPLTIESVISKCNNDIHRFTTEYKCKDYKKFKISPASSYKNMGEIINLLTRYIETISRCKFQLFDYRTELSKHSSPTQQKLWIARTYIFYQLLIFLIQIATTSIIPSFKISALQYKITLKDLEHCSLGIFGSITPSSDIDLGIQYSGTLTDKNFIWWLVEIYESLYLDLTGKSSLEFDIETYADYISMPSKDGKLSFFYLRTTDFKLIHFQKMLPYIGCSILRNALISYKHTNKIEEFQSNHVTDSFINDFEFNISKYIPDSTLPNYHNIEQIWSEPSWQTHCKKIILDSQCNYTDKRAKYYKLAKDAEESLLSLKLRFMNSSDTIPLFDTESILDTMLKISHALVYREESYICPPTVVHIVRILQANPTKKLKRECTYPLQPACSMGYYGYLMSLIEQCGYINRFTTTVYHKL